MIDKIEETARGIAEFYLESDCSCEQDVMFKVCRLTRDIKDFIVNRGKQPLSHLDVWEG